MENKLRAFEYLIYLLIKWAKEYYEEDEVYKQLDRLKIFKMLFLVTTVDSNKSNPNLLRIFNRFAAMPLGPVEIDIYNNLSNLILFSINKHLVLKNPDIQLNSHSFDNVDLDVKRMINNSVNKLRHIAPSLIFLRSSTLVEITHRWKSWKITYSSNTQNNAIIPLELILDDTKQYK